MVLRALVVLMLCSLAPVARAETDLAPTSGAWNGLSGLLEIAREDGVPATTPTSIRLADLTSTDALVVIHPTTPLPIAEITAFLRRGGRFAISDDFGLGDGLLGAFRIDREAPSTVASASALRDQPALLIARPAGSHPLTQDVTAIVTNHPMSVRHADLEAIFTLGDGSALVLAGAVGSGRLIAIADSSLFINNMLELDGNRQLARNLLHYLHGDDGGRVFVAIGDTAMGPRLTDRVAAPIDGLRALLQRVANVTLPPSILTLMTWTLCAFGILLLAGHVQLKSPYARMSLFVRSQTLAGFAGRVAFFRQHQRNMVQPLLAFKVEFEAELLRRVGSADSMLLRDVVQDLNDRGASTLLVQQTRTLMSELDRIADQETRGSEPPLVNVDRFRDMVANGERILADIGRLGLE